MNNDSKAIDYYTLKPAQFHVLEYLQMRQDKDIFEERYETTLEIVLSHHSPSNSSRLKCVFSGVSQIKYIPAIWRVLSFGFIDIKPVETPDGGIAYHISDSEQDNNFEFMCKDFSAEIIT